MEKTQKDAEVIQYAQNARKSNLAVIQEKRQWEAAEIECMSKGDQPAQFKRSNKYFDGLVAEEDRQYQAVIRPLASEGGRPF